jgi:hypothetical protein
MKFAPAPHANLEDGPLSQGDDALANIADGLRIAHQVYETGINMIRVDWIIPFYRA